MTSSRNHSMTGVVLAGLLLFTACGTGAGSDPLALSDPLPEQATAAPEPTAVPPTDVPEPTPVPPTAVPTATEVPPTPTPEPTPTEVPPTPTPAPEPDTADTTDTSDSPTEADDDAADDDDSTADTDGAEEPAVTIPVDLVLGGSVFAASCANCHAVDGTGTNQGPAVVGIGQFFVDDDSPIVNLVTNGGTRMPEFGTKLSPEEIEAVVDYVVATFP